MTKPEANRKNSLKSTGPKTQIGKKNVRLNAVKHGFCAHEMIIRRENKAEIKKLQRGLHAPAQDRVAEARVQADRLLSTEVRIGCPARHAPGERLSLSSRGAGILTRHSSQARRGLLYAARPKALPESVRFLHHLKIEVEPG